MKQFLQKEKVLIGHNIQRYDLPTLRRILGIHISSRFIDTLSLSWYLEPEKQLHGLSEWGQVFGVPKPKVDDWKDQPVEVYIHRCTEDVKINVRLWHKFKKKLLNLYNSKEEADKLLDYLEFKMDCAAEQERSKWKLDVERCSSELEQLEQTKVGKLGELRQAMPKVRKVIPRIRPLKPYKKDGTLSVSGARWFELLRRSNLPDTYEGQVEEVVGEEDGNPSSSQQIKSWLGILGWKPQTFKYVREDKVIRKIPQVSLDHGGGICPSVKLLYPIEPSLKLLDGLAMVSHRISLLKGFLREQENGYIKAEISGLTNTLRFKHKTVVNLPKITAKYGEIIRGVLIAPKKCELCGADMASLEDRLKQHYIYPYDPAYVEEMNVPDYDPHLSLALLAGEVSSNQVQEYKDGTSKAIAPIRSIFKNGNYACQYGAGPPRLALTANITLAKATMVWETYWQKNWAIKEVAKNQIVKKLNGQMWLLNPISNLWYSLRYEKDIFSTLVQGSAAYVFDLWVRYIRSKRSQLTAQFHDEVVLCIKKGYREQSISLLQWAIDQTNSQLNLNRQLSISIQFGDKYSEIH